MKKKQRQNWLALIIVSVVVSVSFLYDTVCVAYAESDRLQEEAFSSRATLSQCNTTYKHLLIIYPSTDVAYIKDGVTKRFRGSMSSSLRTTVTNAFKNLPNLINDGSAGAVSSTYKIIINYRTIKRISKLWGSYYWLSPQDIQSDLLLYAPKGKYDSVHVVWYSGPINVYWGLGGVFINNGTTTLSSIVAGNAWWWSEDGVLGEIFLHEWLHAVSWFYEYLGYPMPENDADGAGGHGYVWYPDEGWMDYYRDLMQGQVWEPNLSAYTGITREAWCEGTPSHYQY